MPIVKRSQVVEYVGTNAERLALPGYGIGAGSTFEETDTGCKYKYNGSQWVPDNLMASIGAKNDTAASDGNGNSSIVSIAKGIFNKILGVLSVEHAEGVLVTNNLSGLNSISGPHDVGKYRSIALQVKGTWAGTLTFQFSNDSITWNGGMAIPASSVSNPTITTTSNGVWNIPVVGKYFRIIMSAYVSGTANILILEQHNAVVSPSISISGSPGINISQVGGQSVQTAGVNGVQQISVGGGTSSNNCTNLKVVSSASTNATLVKASAGRLHSLKVSNMSASDRFLKLYNKATAPIVGTDVPIATFPIPANSKLPTELIQNDVGMYFNTGIAFAITGGLPDNDSTNIGANEVILNIIYG